MYHRGPNRAVLGRSRQGHVFDGMAEIICCRYYQRPLLLKPVTRIAVFT